MNIFQPVNPKGSQSWIFIGRTDAETETRILWPPDVKNWLIGKDPEAGEDWRQEEKGMAEGEMVGWYHQLDGHEFEQALSVGDGQGILACCSPCGCKESDTTERLNWTELMNIWLFIQFMGFSRQEYWGGFARRSSGGPHYVRTPQWKPSILNGPAWHGS